MQESLKVPSKHLSHSTGMPLKKVIRQCRIVLLLEHLNPLPSMWVNWTWARQWNIQAVFFLSRRTGLLRADPWKTFAIHELQTLKRYTLDVKKGPIWRHFTSSSFKYLQPFLKKWPANASSTSPKYIEVSAVRYWNPMQKKNSAGHVSIYDVKWSDSNWRTIFWWKHLSK